MHFKLADLSLYIKSSFICCRYRFFPAYYNKNFVIDRLFPPTPSLLYYVKSAFEQIDPIYPALEQVKKDQHTLSQIDRTCDIRLFCLRKPQVLYVCGYNSFKNISQNGISIEPFFFFVFFFSLTNIIKCTVIIVKLH